MAETLTPEQEAALLNSAAEELRLAQTAEDIRVVWRKYYLQVGHRKLGRLLVARPQVERSTSTER